MTLVDQLYAEIAEREERIKQIRKECTHPAAARSTEAYSVCHSVYEDSDDGYIGSFVDKTLPGERITCGLCGGSWVEVDGEVWTKWLF